MRRGVAVDEEERDGECRSWRGRSRSRDPARPRESVDALRVALGLVERVVAAQRESVLSCKARGEDELILPVKAAGLELVVVEPGRGSGDGVVGDRRSRAR